MRVALLSVFSDNYKPLADITWNQNKALYCARHGFTGYNIEVSLDHMGFRKFQEARNILDHHDYVWITGTDSLITNYNIDVRNHLDLACDRNSFIAAYDRNGLNA